MARLPADKPSIYPPLYFKILERNTDIRISLDMHATNLKNSTIRFGHIDDIDGDDDYDDNNSILIYLCTDLTDCLIITKQALIYE